MALPGTLKRLRSTAFYRFLEHHTVISLLIFCTIVMLPTSLGYFQKFTPTGDEPHYLIISQTVIRYQSLDVMRDYSHQDYRAFYPTKIDPHTATSSQGKVLPAHGIGGPLLWLIPFFLFGRIGAVLFMTAITIGIILIIYAFLREMGVRKRYALFVSGAYAVASPLYTFSHLSFVEPIGAFVCLFVLWTIFQPRLHATNLIISSLALGFLPWVHIRFAIVEAPLIFFLLYRIYREYRFSQFRAYLEALVPIAALSIGFEIYNYIVWNSLNPGVSQFSNNAKLFQFSPFTPFVGMLFDQEYGLLIAFPFFLLIVPGIIVTLQRKYLLYHLILACVSIPYILLVATWFDWKGGLTPPARFLLLLLPLFSFYIAMALQEVRTLAIRLWAGASIAYSFIYSLLPLVSGNTNNGFNGGNGRNSNFAWIQQVLPFRLTSLLPSSFKLHQTFLFALWIAVAVGAVLVMLYSEHFARWVRTTWAKNKARVTEARKVF